MDDIVCNGSSFLESTSILVSTRQLLGRHTVREAIGTTSPMASLPFASLPLASPVLPSLTSPAAVAAAATGKEDSILEPSAQIESCYNFPGSLASFLLEVSHVCAINSNDAVYGGLLYRLVARAVSIQPGVESGHLC
ncbi:hypothetical protein NX059_000907 [Plenodomus lindquistii]|nr:hypothetical protein NX059_000907 [Plenodomus lindquistii]